MTSVFPSDADLLQTLDTASSGEARYAAVDAVLDNRALPPEDKAAVVRVVSRVLRNWSAERAVLWVLQEASHRLRTADSDPLWRMVREVVSAAEPGTKLSVSNGLATADHQAEIYLSGAFHKRPVWYEITLRAIKHFPEEMRRKIDNAETLDQTERDLITVAMRLFVTEGRFNSFLPPDDYMRSFVAACMAEEGVTPDSRAGKVVSAFNTPQHLFRVMGMCGDFEDLTSLEVSTTAWVALHSPDANMRRSAHQCLGDPDRITLRGWARAEPQAQDLQ